MLSTLAPPIGLVPSLCRTWREQPYGKGGNHPPRRGSPARHPRVSGAAQGRTLPLPKVAELMNEAREDVLAFRHFPQPHWKKVWSTNLLERVNVALRGALGSAVITWKAAACSPQKAWLPSRNWRICQPCSAQPPRAPPADSTSAAGRGASAPPE